MIQVSQGSYTTKNFFTKQSVKSNSALPICETTVRTLLLSCSIWGVWSYTLYTDHCLGNTYKKTVGQCLCITIIAVPYWSMYIQYFQMLHTDDTIICHKPNSVLLMKLRQCLSPRNVIVFFITRNGHANLAVSSWHQSSRKMNYCLWLHEHLLT
jgi:hypothetical protein